MNRRSFLADAGMGCAGLALGSMLFKDGVARAADGPHGPARAKSVIWLFMVGGTSQMESFDPKPELNKHAGKTIAESPFKATLDSPYLKKNLREFVAGLHKIHPKLYPMQVGYKKYGKAGIELAEWWPNVGGIVDELAIVRSMWTTDNDHGAQLQFHTGRHALEGAFPTIGSWVHYGLGSLNENLPQYVVLGTPLADCCGGVNGHGSHYLGPEHNGVRLNVDPKNPLPFGVPPGDKFLEEQKAEFDLLGKLNRLSGSNTRTTRSSGRDQVVRAGLPDADCRPGPGGLLEGDRRRRTPCTGSTTRRRRRSATVPGGPADGGEGVRFVQVFHGSNGGAGAWDAHGGLKANHSGLCAQVDRPIAGLITDLKRGLLNDTLVVWGTEFGRTPGAQGADGRDHHPYGFSIRLGAGVKKGVVRGRRTRSASTRPRTGTTSPTSRDRLTLMGLDSRRLEVPGRKRLDVDHGR